MFEKAALSPLQLEDSELQDEVTHLLKQLGKHDSGWSSWTFWKVIMHLGSYSLIEYDHQNRTYGTHPLVHHWSGTTIEENGHDMQKLVLAIIALSFSLTQTDEDRKYRLEVRAVAARGIYESLTIHRLASVTKMFHYIINLLQKW